MCFVTRERDWSAEWWREGTAPAKGEAACDECGRAVAAGSPLYSLHERESPYCQNCHGCPADEVHDADEDAHACACEEPDFGETLDYEACPGCRKFLRAVEAAEREAGCAAHESLPYLTDMLNAVQDGGAREAFKYFRAAVRMYPELRESGYLAFLWRKLFVE